jgi:signal transduction histidine kinase
VTDEMRRHVERELVRARAGIRVRTGAPQRLRPVIEQIVGVLRGRRAASLSIGRSRLRTTSRFGRTSQDIAEIFGSLGENAAKWAAGRVRVEGRCEGTVVNVSVEDDGPGVPDDQIGSVLARGGRLDEAQPGTGLGSRYRSRVDGGLRWITLAEAPIAWRPIGRGLLSSRSGGASLMKPACDPL